MDRCTCPPADQLVELIHERLPADEQASVAVHVEDCAACQKQLDELLVDDSVSTWSREAENESEPAPDEAFLSSLRQLLPQVALSSAFIAKSHEANVQSGVHRTEEVAEFPTTIGAYEIIGEVARGGMAVVYKARQPQLGRTVAIKRLRFRDHEQSDVERFFREAEAVARLRHPNVVQVFQVGEDNGVPFLALEYINGPTLADFLKGMPIEPRSAASFLRKVSSGVHHAHVQGIIHRDLKPANILLDPDADLILDLASSNGHLSKATTLYSYEPKVTDFGLARRVGDDRHLTLPDVLAGTPAYLAPEQISRGWDAVTPACDVYALGAILYEMLTGRPPLMGPNVLATLRLVESTDPVPPRRLQPHIPRDLESVCMKCLAKEPHRRYASAAELAGDLERFLDGKPTAARPLGFLARIVKLVRRHPFGSCAILLIVVAATCGLAGILWQWQEAVSARGQLQVALNSEAEQRRDAEENLYIARLAQAVQLWESGDANQARALLIACCPAAGRADLRGWEWHYLTRLFRPETRMVELRGWIGGLATNPVNPNELIVAAGRPKLNMSDTSRPGDGLAGMLHLDHWEEGLQVGPKMPGTATCVAIHPKGNLIVWGTVTGDLVFYCKNGETPTRTIPTKAPGGGVTGIAFTPNGATLAVGAEGGRLQLFDAATATLLAERSPRVGGQCVVAINAMGTLAICAGTARHARLFSIPDWKIIGEISDLPGNVSAMANAPIGSQLAIGCSDGTVILWDSNSRTELRRLAGPDAPVYSLAFRTDGSTLAVGGADRAIRLWDLKSGKTTVTYRGHGATIRSLAFGGGDNWLASGAQDGTIRLWDATVNPRGRRIPFDSRLNEAVFCQEPDALFVRAASLVGKVVGWNVADGAIAALTEMTFRARLSYPVRYIAFVDSGRQIAAIAPEDPNVIAISSSAGERVTTLARAQGPILTLASDPDGKLLAWASPASDGGICVDWRHLVTGIDGQSARLPVASIRALAIDSTGGQIAAITVSKLAPENSVWVIDATGQQLPRMVEQGTGMLGGLAFSPDGGQLAVSVGDSVRIFRIDTGEPIFTMPCPPATTSLAYSSNGQRLAAVGYDGVTTMFDPRTGKRVIQLPGLAPRRPGEMASNARVAFSPDGNWMLSTNWDGSLNVWDGSPLPLE